MLPLSKRYCTPLCHIIHPIDWLGYSDGKQHTSPASMENCKEQSAPLLLWQSSALTALAGLLLFKGGELIVVKLVFSKPVSSETHYGVDEETGKMTFQQCPNLLCSLGMWGHIQLSSRTAK